MLNQEPTVSEIYPVARREPIMNPYFFVGLLTPPSSFSSVPEMR